MVRLNSIRIVNAALTKNEHGRWKLRGDLDLESMHLLQTADYQREQEAASSLKSILEALGDGEPLPEIELGMRGKKYHERDGAIYLQDPTFIIDGLQRVGAVTYFRSQHPEKEIGLSATVHFDTTEEWERERFLILNTKRKRVSPNKHLYNSRHGSKGVLSAFGLSNEKGFPLCGRISWRQNMMRGELIGAMTYVKVIVALHAHHVGTGGDSLDEIITKMNKMTELVGMQIARDNVKTFFELVDKCWGVRHVQRRESAPQVKYGFLVTLARLISEAPTFWAKPDEKRLFIDASWQRSFKKFQLTDPEHRMLSTGTGKPLDRLFIYIYEEINKSKRHKRLRLRSGRYQVLVSSFTNGHSPVADESDESEEGDQE